MSDGANAQIYSVHDGENQNLYLQQTEDGYYTIMNMKSGKYLTVQDGKRISGANVAQYASNNSDSQLWSVLPNNDGTYSFVSKCGGKTLEIAGGILENGRNVQTYQGNQTTAQKWALSIVAHVHTKGERLGTTAPTCTEQGYTTYLCPLCGEQYQADFVAALGHDYVFAGNVPESCSAYAYDLYRCSRCGNEDRRYIGGEWSEWSDTAPSDISAVELRTRTLYRYRDQVTEKSYETAMDGYTQTGSEWVQSSTGTVSYVKNWPSGFDTNNSLYAQYHRTAVSASETATTKTEVSEATEGYIYYHWCYGTYTAGPINRYISETYSSEFPCFHAFYSTQDISYNAAAEAYQCSNANVCRDTYWYFRTTVTKQTYTNYNKLFTYTGWGEWSEWSETAAEASDTRQVETKTQYSYMNLPQGEHDYARAVTWQPTPARFAETATQR